MIDLPAGTAFQGDFFDPATGVRLVRILPAWFGAYTPSPLGVPTPQDGEELPLPPTPPTWRWTADGYLPIPT